MHLLLLLLRRQQQQQQQQLTYNRFSKIELFSFQIKKILTGRRKKFLKSNPRLQKGCKKVAKRLQKGCKKVVKRLQLIAGIRKQFSCQKNEEINFETFFSWAKPKRIVFQHIMGKQFCNL